MAEDQRRVTRLAQTLRRSEVGSDGCGVFRWSIRGLWLDGEPFNNGSQMMGIMYWKMNDSRSSLVLVLVGAKMEGYE